MDNCTRPKVLTILCQVGCFVGAFILSLPFTTIVALPFAMLGQVDTGISLALCVSLLVAIRGIRLVARG